MQIKVENLYYLLCYAWGFLEERDLVEVGSSEVRTAEALFARVLAGAARRLLRQRLDRGYLEEVSEFRRPRGKIRLTQSVRSGALLRGALDCALDEASEDVLHNRIIKATVKRMATIESLDLALRDELVAIAREMRAVSDASIITRDFRSVQLHSNVRRYRFALSVCQLLHRCLLPDERRGQWRFQSFTGSHQEMGALFEAFVREFLIREQDVFPDVKRSVVRWGVEGDEERLLPVLNVDILMRRPGHKVVLETKCYRDPLVSGRFGGRQTLRSEDVSQLVAYLSNYSAPKERLTGVLLYAVDRHRVPASAMRLLGYEVRVLEVNLNQPWQDIDRDLRALVHSLDASPEAQPSVNGSLP